MTAPKWWDFTLPQDKWKLDEIIDMLDKNGAEKYVIGDEVGEGGYKHWQGRVIFKVPKEMTTVCNLLGFCNQMGHGMEVRWGHVSPTSREGRNWDYVKKEGKWYCSWEKALSKFAHIELNTWQCQAQEFFNNQNDRQVYVIVDEVGNHGKSWFSKYLEATHQADVCPVTDGDASNYIEYCCKHPAKGYVFDVPRADSIKSKKAMWRAIEQIKNGLLYDRRYTSEKIWIDPPKIIVFANEEPDTDTLSADRWIIHRITDSGLGPLLLPA